MHNQSWFVSTLVFVESSESKRIVAVQFVLPFLALATALMFLII